MRKVCEMCGGTGHINSWTLNGTTGITTSIPCNMCGGQGYIEDTVYQTPNKELSDMMLKKISESDIYRKRIDKIMEVARTKLPQDIAWEMYHIAIGGKDGDKDA